MPILINEVLAEVEPVRVPTGEAPPPPESTPLAQTEFELVQTLALIEERRRRLLVD